MEGFPAPADNLYVFWRVMLVSSVGKLLDIMYRIQIAGDEIWTLQYTGGRERGERGSLVVKALGCKPEGRGFETIWGEFFQCTNPSSRTIPWGSHNL
jgi:hypothetical protein